MSRTRLTWGVLLYVAPLLLFPLPLIASSCVPLRDRDFPPLDVVLGRDCVSLALPTFLLAVVLWLAGVVCFFYDCIKALKSFGIRGSVGWLALRAVVVGLTLASFYA